MEDTIKEFKEKYYRAPIDTISREEKEYRLSVEGGTVGMVKDFLTEAHKYLTEERNENESQVTEKLNKLGDFLMNNLYAANKFFVKIDTNFYATYDDFIAGGYDDENYTEEEIKQKYSDLQKGTVEVLGDNLDDFFNNAWRIAKSK